MRLDRGRRQGLLYASPEGPERHKSADPLELGVLEQTLLQQQMCDVNELRMNRIIEDIDRFDESD